MPVAAPLELSCSVHPFDRVHRIVPSRFPPVGIFDRLGDPDDLQALFELEGQTNDRLDDGLGDIGLVAAGDRLVGPGTTPIMAAFTHPALSESRFTDGTYGIYYCADTSDAAIRESAHHRARFLRMTQEPQCRLEMRLYVGMLQTALHDGLDGALPASVLDPDSYEISQAWGRALRDDGAYGLTYPSVRYAGGRCAALFRPPAIGPVTQSAHYQFVFDGEDISQVVQLGDYHVL
ncbi:RES family NAD+ phosphorylase [Salinisphaera sp. SWV1]|uniref:RES family NAD+ phosphorylase n=1 Tax=Salinisphaera sp. SWV1 TaxID=3454139 RepID=UPI003F874A1C